MMNWLRQSLNRFRSFFRGARLDRDLDAEMAAHLEFAIEENMQHGMPAAEARRQALIRFGGATQSKEQHRETRGLPLIETSLQDLRFALRMLRKNPGFAAIAILTLGLGIGATTVVFSVLDNVLLEPFPFKNADRYTIFYVHDTSQAGEGGRPAYSVSDFLDFQEQNHVFAQIMGASRTDVLYSRADGTRQFDGTIVTSNSFDFLGVPPLLGRAITREDGNPGSPLVFAMSYRLWQKEFAGDPQIVGTTLTLNGQRRTLVAIMPPRFLFNGVDIWMPITLTRSGGPDQPRLMGALGLLKRGLTLQDAAADLDVIAKRLSKISPREYPAQFTIRTIRFADAVVGLVGRFKPVLYTLIAAVGMLLLIACSNVANLLLVRATTREKEIAVRASIGASRGRVIRQLLVEALLLAMAGAVAGCLLAYGGLKGVAAVIPRNAIATETVIELNGAALWVALGLSVLATLLAGVAPTLHSVRQELQAHLASAGKGASSGARHGKLRDALVIAEVALSIVLLVGAGLTMRSFFGLARADLGFNPMNVLHARVPFPQGQYNTPAQQKAFFQEVLRRAQALPGAVAVTEAVSLPPYGGPVSEVDVLGKTHTERWDAMMQLCSYGYFETLGRHLLEGRLLSETDIDSVRQVAIVNQTLARNFFGGQNPLGQKIKFNSFDGIADAPHDAYFEVVGVVADAKNRGLEDPPLPEAYIPYTVSTLGNRTILLKTAVNPDSMIETLRREIWAVDNRVALTDIGSLETFLKDRAYARPQFAVICLGSFAAIGLALVIVGVFSVMDYAVSLRTHEFGIRVALGAQRKDINAMVLLKGFRLTAAGVVVGLIASFGLARLLASQVWGISTTDPLTFVGVGVLLSLVGLIASHGPARRAMRVDPMVALRYE